MTSLTLEEIASSNGGGSTETETSDSDDDSLPAVFDEIGADLERVEAFRDHSSTTDDQLEQMVEFARDLANDDGNLWTLMEKSRELSDLYRIEINHIRGKREGPFIDEFKDALFGDSDDPDPGTKNYVDAERRDHETANLAWYKVMFPEPTTDFSGQPVVWYEFDDIGLPVDDKQDSHIYVTQEWAESYMEYGEEIDGQLRPLPPEEVPTGTDTALNPSDYTVSELGDALAEIDDPSTLGNIYDAEQAGKDRKTAKEAIDARREEVVGGDDSPDLAGGLREMANALENGEIDDPSEAKLGDFM